MKDNSTKFRVGSVSYLNPVPLVWGMLQGPQREQVELSFSIPSICAQELEQGKTQVGLVPVAEISRQHLDVVPGVGITCHGPVRSILLFSRVPWTQIRTLAADLSSRTSVELARIILRERYGVLPQVTPEAPVLETMLSHADAALVIGDPALRVPLEHSAFEWLDLGSEWLALTGLPMVFAAWGCRPGLPIETLQKLFRASYEFGKAHLDEIVQREHAARGISRELAGDYLRHHIRYELATAELRGLEAFLELAGLPSLAVAQ